MRSAVRDFAYDVLQTDNVASDVLLDLCVGLYVHSLFPYFPMKFLVDELTDQFLVGFPPSYVIFHSLQLSDVGRGALDENSSVDLSQVKLGKDDFLWVRDVSGTSNSKNNEEFSDSVDL